MKRILVAGLGLATAGSLVIAAPALAADRPNSLADARKAAPTAVNAWINDETIGSSSDQDWYHYELSRDAWVTVTLGTVPADYTVALYGDDGKVIATPARPGRQFELITKKLTAGTYFVKVSTPKSSSPVPYRLRFREMPQNSVFVADQTTRFRVEGGQRYGQSVHTLFNSTDQWQKVTTWLVQPLTAAGVPTGDEYGPNPGLQGNSRRIAPGGTLPFDTGWLEVTDSTTKFSITTEQQPIGQPVATGLSIEFDPRFKTERQFGGTNYLVLIHNTSSKRRKFDAYAKNLSSIGNLDYLGGAVGDVGPRSTLPFIITLNDTTKIPNLVRLTVENAS